MNISNKYVRNNEERTKQRERTTIFLFSLLPFLFSLVLAGCDILGGRSIDALRKKAREENKIPGTESNPIPLIADIWANGSITSVAREIWYSFNAVSGTKYYVWANDSDYVLRS